MRWIVDLPTRQGSSTSFFSQLEGRNSEFPTPYIASKGTVDQLLAYEHWQTFPINMNLNKLQAQYDLTRIEAEGS